METTLEALLARHPGDTAAVGATDPNAMTYAALRTLSQDIRASLHQLGIGHGDRVAVVLANGPHMATAFVTIAQTAVTAPLNPAYREEEFAFYLEDLGAKALVVASDYSGPALDAAARLGTQVIRLSVTPEGPAGAFYLAAETRGESAPDVAKPDAEDTCLILHTSGTTSRPKIVPLSQANVSASAQNIAASLALSPKDRGMNVMPLFHIHGLVAAVSASLAAGASIWCTPGFDALRFFAQMREIKPTWYTAVPTMHQAILSRAGRNADAIETAPLRFVRSSSASLPPQVMDALRKTFGVPVIEAYGMTEAAHQMASNPLPPRAQKAGSVGVAAGPAVQIAHESEDRLVDGTGEVVISGPNVTAGYENNSDANAKSFFLAEGARWFRTGDQGAFDDDGYLFLTGRLKEIINRGGEKVSPLEVDSVLLDHPDIAQVVTFALPHTKLGEEVAAAVVLREGASADEAAIRAFASEHMAGFKVPRRVVIVAEIPKGATGKMQRIGMAEKLGLVASAG
ncbi:MAG: acyl--CoA ligase [Pseudomonadota bacterium]